MTEKEFHDSLVAPVQFSMSASKIAVDRAANNRVKEFAGFELAETTAITAVLKTMETIFPEMDEETKKSFAIIESTAAGNAFDKLYIRSQLKNHRLLRDLTEDYLNEAPKEQLDKIESEDKLIATLILPFLEEHVTIIERLGKKLGLAEHAL